jgi:hypothetical protein
MKGHTSSSRTFEGWIARGPVRRKRVEDLTRIQKEGGVRVPDLWQGGDVKLA